MTRAQNISVVIAALIVGIFAGYFLALPGGQVVAPRSGGMMGTSQAVTGSPSAPQAENAIDVAMVSVRDTSNQLYKISGEYPQFGTASPAFNESIANFVNGDIATFKSSSAANIAARQATMSSGTKNTIPPQSFTFMTSWEPTQINDRYISITVRTSYYDGGANGSEDVKTFNYDIQNGKILGLGDLFPNVTNYLGKIAAIAQAELKNSVIDASQSIAQMDMLKQGTAPTSGNYANFTFDDDTVTFYFSKYQVAPGSYGEQKAVIVRQTVK